MVKSLFWQLFHLYRGGLLLYSQFILNDRQTPIGVYRLFDGFIVRNYP